MKDLLYENSQIALFIKEIDSKRKSTFNVSLNPKSFQDLKYLTRLPTRYLLQYKQPLKVFFLNNNYFIFISFLLFYF